ncbi:MAG: hypothetical protein COW32_08390 [Candidatus Aquicultor secundus]|uniref:Fido domain-containing protein n=1 Tax=Candidatus Aquicultor secundus TaxID=1973895 RepID=A0A2M7T5D2_9ACTN|nr:Fic family protein [Candidatus Aquicultor secundus]NCS68181.1 Fic family protein [Candidatus Peregrinibacteria bacterium]PIU27104.1 MAG: hypothetical protein COT10_05150 [Candidatus Aquicultor secundus]PIW21727.1 MAG: hypothetical protein COW32_08390 [Candidatus Aquicultor secundus]PIY40258.1 MAG: hypothetical protein COZ03_04500 [Candidatus Aquicultor secundus]PIZ35403.1 MAG: hypothetical protein COY37_10410 [Candidatus Aquicultor secundus]
MKKTIKSDALEWWAEKTKSGDHVVSSSEVPGQRQREILVKEKFLYPIIKGVWILKRPEDDIEDIFLLLYWQVVKKILARYSHWSLRGKSALLVLDGDHSVQKHLLVRINTKTTRKITLPLGYDISLAYDPRFDERLIKNVEIAGLSVPVDVAERVLVDAGKLEPSAEVKSFIAGNQFNKRLIEAVYASSPKPYIFARLIRMAKEANRLGLVADLEKIVETHTHYRVAKREKIETSTPLKAEVISPPWVVRQELEIRDFEKALSEQFSPRIKSLEKKPLDKLIAQAKEHKKYDTYHSTTLEGYRITPEEVEALLSGDIPEERKSEGDKYFEEIKNRMAILGYSEAFDFVMGRIQADFGHPVASEGLVQDTYYHLFKPSADAKLIDYITLVSYRNMMVFIRGSSYVPPSHEKLADLMRSFVTLINEIENPVIKAILAHYLFVTIHPYIDGNGRTARLLMNYFLLSSGYSWITIRADQRTPYFNALKTANLEQDILMFGEFIIGMIEKASG